MEIKIPKEQCIDGRTEPFEITESPFVTQYYLGFMRNGWGSANDSPTLLFIERWNPYVGAFPQLEGWVVRAEPAGPSSLTNSFYLHPDNKDPWKYKRAVSYPTVESALEWVNHTLRLLPKSYYANKKRLKSIENLLKEEENGVH